jgi:O-antigen/teichoic acid export membrane protein
MYIEKRNISFFFITNVVGVASSFLLMIAFANLVDKSSYGTYQYILSVASVIGACSLTGIGPAFVRAVGKKEYGFLKYGQQKAIRWSIIPLTIGFAVSGYYFIAGNHLIALSILICVIILLITDYLSRFVFILNGLGDFFKSNVILTAQALGPAVLLLPLLFYVQNPLVLTTVYVGSVALSGFIANLFLKTSNILPSFDLTVVNTAYNNTNIKFAIHQSLIYVINIITTNFDKIFLFQTLGAHQTASYVVAISLPNRIRSLTKQFEPYIFSKFANHSEQAVKAKLTSKFIATLLLTVPIFLVYALFARYFFSTFLPQYTDMAMLSIVYALSLFGGASIVPFAALKAHANETYAYYYTGATSVITVGALIIGVSVAGLTGAVIAKTISMLINTFLVFIFAQRLEMHTDNVSN